MSDWNKQIIEEFRANDGKVGGNFANNTLLLLHTRGAKSGQDRVNPLVTIEDADRLVVVASKGGGPTNPDWYYNVVANPGVEVEYGSEKYEARATVTSEPERSELYGKMEEVLSAFTTYKEQMTRIMPVITLTRST